MSSFRGIWYAEPMMNFSLIHQDCFNKLKFTFSSHLAGIHTSKGTMNVCSFKMLFSNDSHSPFLWCFSSQLSSFSLFVNKNHKNGRKFNQSDSIKKECRQVKHNGRSGFIFIYDKTCCVRNPDTIFSSENPITEIIH